VTARGEPASPNGVALVVGAGDGLGAAVARRFARAGYVACVARRGGEKLAPLCEAIAAAGGRAHAFGVDARREEEVVALFDRVEREVGPIEVAVHNIGANVNFSILEMDARKYRKVWEMACFSGFLVGREAARRMVPRGRGTILFTGATASVRGGAGFAAFAGAKHALRALAQAMARELGPRGLHVAHVVVDGPVDMPWIRSNFPDMVAARPPDGLLAPDAVAESYFALHAQQRSAWTHELDLRPWAETF
jgi:NAD(P)-dependent dehydrogenase (short-subunit alcohol dehydrogenase family)